MLNGLIRCEDCKPGFFSTKEGKEIFLKAKKIGTQKYGFEDTRLLLFGGGKRKGELLVQNIVDFIMQECKFITVRDSTGRLPHIYAYEDGYYKLFGEDLIVQQFKKILNNQNIPYKTRYKNEILDYVKTENIVERDEINPPKYLLNLNNGIYNTLTRKLIPHNSDYYFLYKIPWDYKPKAKCPKVMKYLNSTLKPEFIELTQEIFGYCLMFDYRHAAIFYLYGTGGNGKKIWTKMLEHMLGAKNVTNKSIDSLIRFRFTSALLYGKLANICGELTTSVLNDTDMLKSLSGGDSIQAEFKGKDGFDFENRAKIITACNSIPNCKDMTDGWHQRQYIIPFLEKFRHTKQEDTELLDKLLVQKEMEGLLAWALVGMHRLLKNKQFSYPLDKQERYLMYRENTRYFVQKFYIKTNEFNDTLKSDDIYKHYSKWCKENNVPIDSKNALGRTLTYMKITFERVLEEGAHKYIDTRRYIKKV
jgi:putative DNA primase/helicase